MSVNEQTEFDVVILGGGLSGLCLARQLQLETSGLSILILESRGFPAPIAAHKVGESTVEIGAHYLADTLSLKPYLDEHHLKKFGLRCFFGDANNIDKADELGASESLPVSSYQLDRGLLENHLFDLVSNHGCQVLQNARVIDVHVTESGQSTVKFVSDGVRQAVNGHWLIDASGRRGLLRKQKGLKTSNTLEGNACWFRINERISVDNWSNDAAWHERVCGAKRWLSTNHLMGPGYWVWLIPLSSGATSIGIVSDAGQHKQSQFASYERTLNWLQTRQPQLANALQGCEPLDFKWLKNYSYGCAKVFSGSREKQRWALTGEAGLFLDPFYSPGMDFIAYSNTFISDLIRREKLGENIRSRQALYQQTYLSVYESSLNLYANQYPGFGNFHIMSLKTVWDYAYYWGVLGLLFFNKALTDNELLSSKSEALLAVRRIHKQIQDRFALLAKSEPLVKPNQGFTNHAAMPLMQKLNGELQDRLSGDALAIRLDENLQLLHQLADELSGILEGEYVPNEHCLVPELSYLADHYAKPVASNQF